MNRHFTKEMYEYLANKHMKTYAHTDLLMNAHSSVIHSSQKTRSNFDVHQLGNGDIKHGITIQQNNAIQ